MHEKKKLRLKKFYLHPVTTYIIMTVIVIICSGIFSLFQMQGTYNVVNTNTNELEPILVAVENMFSFKGIKYIISNATRNFLSFAPLGTLLISLIGLTIAEATGFIETFTKKYLKKIPKEFLTFIIMFIAISSSLINEVGYAILIPLVALIYFINDRNPILGIITAFCGVSFGYGVSIFIGTTEVALLKYTRSAAKLIYDTIHIPLSSNLFFIIVTTIILAIVGTIIIEKLIAPKIGKYKKEEESKTEQYNILDIELNEQEKIAQEKLEKRGLRFSLITGLIILLIFIYSLIPNLPYSGMLLDTSEKTYLNQVFGPKSYFENGFTFLTSFFLLMTGLAYGLGAKTIKNDQGLINKASEKVSKLGSVFLLLFVSSQFIAIYKKTNIGMVITSWLANLLGMTELTSFPLIIISILFIGISNLFLTGSRAKWMIFAPIMVPMFMQTNISPAFAQIIMRAGDSITNGFTPLLASFAIYVGYLNIYNLNKNKPYTIKKSLSMITPYFILISIAWILIIVGWYIIGLPIGPNVYPSI